MPEPTVPMWVDAPLIMSMSADLASSGARHLTWSVGYAPEPETNGSRFLIAHLHASNANFVVDIDVSGDLIGDKQGSLGDQTRTKAFEALLASVPSLNVLYFTARTAALSMIGLLDEAAKLPMTPPSPSITQLVRADAADEGS